MDIQILLALQNLREAIGIGIVHFFLQASEPLLFMTVYLLAFRWVEKRTKTAKNKE